MNKFIVSCSPHIRDNVTTQSIMGDVVIALCPTLIASVFIFGWRALLINAVCVAVAIGSEWAFEKLCKKPVTVGDLSAVITGMMVAFNLPVNIPLWQAAFGSIVAIVVIKQLFGGIGHNFANPAVTARVVMLLAFSTSMTSWEAPKALADAVTSATPLSLISSGDTANLPSLWNMFIGLRGGSIGETCNLTLLLGGLYLMLRRVISWHTPVAFIGTVFLMGLAFDMMPLYQIFGGAVFLGAFFMATDYATTPSTNWGRIIFGIGCGFLTCAIRFWGNYPEGVSFSILFMNILTPYISRWTVSKPFGGVKA